MKFLLYSIILLLMPLGIWAQDSGFEIQVSRDTVLYGNSVKVVYMINDLDGEFQQPDFEGFEIVQGPYVSSSYTMSNGITSRKTSYTYYLQPMNQGQIILASASVRNGDQIVYSPEVSIYVKANPDNIKVPAEVNGSKNENRGIFGDMDSWEEMFKSFPSPEDLFNNPEESTKAPKSKDKKYRFKTEKI